jgi:phage shock protein PspC (stress-responsive transcriptional regulator)
MNEQRTADPQTGLDKIFAALRGTGIRRRTDDKWIAGVCSGLADRLGVDPVIVRVGLVVLTLLGGVGVTLYLVAWALLPNDRDQIAAERALRDGDGGSIVLLIFAAFALFGGSWWSHDSGWGFPFGLVLTGALVWWLVQRTRNSPDADQRVSAQQSGAPYTSVPSPTTFGPSPATFGPSPATFGPSPTTPVPPQTVPSPVVPRKPRRRSGGPLMALLAIGLALVTYGSLRWLGTEYHWTGDHRSIAIAGSLAAIGLLLVVLGLAGWRSGFVAFLAVILAITAWSSAVVPTGIQLGGQVGDATWTPTSVTADVNYHLGAGDAVLDLSGLPTDGLSEAKVPAYVGLGELTVLVPQGLTVKVVGHVGLGEILLPADADGNHQGGSDINRSVVIGTGPTEVVVDAGVGLGQLTVVKE